MMKYEARSSRAHLRAFLLMLSAAALALVGCSDGNPSNSERTAVTRQVLTFPVTLTIATPNPVKPTQPVIVGSAFVQIGPRAETVTGMAVSMGTQGVFADADALLNETWSRGTADLRDRVHVRGTLHAKTRTLGNSVVITTSDLNPPIDPAQTLTWQVSYPAGTANDITLNSGDARTLD